MSPAAVSVGIHVHATDSKPQVLHSVIPSTVIFILCELQPPVVVKQ